MNIGKVSSLHIYPVKTLSAQRLDSVCVSPKHGFPFDRIFALAHPDRDFRREPSERLISGFHVLTHNSRLAGVRTHCDPETGHFEAYVQEHLVLCCDILSESGRSQFEKFFAAVLDLPDDKAPKLVHAQCHNYSYLDSSSCHIVNLASVRDLSERAGVEIDPLRFRANLYIDTDDPWVEFEWIGGELTIGDDVGVGPFKRAARCAATEVNRVSAVKDIPIPRLIKRFYGHTDFGIYAAITKGGRIQPGMPVALSAHPEGIIHR
ncbi:MOSC domain-containing protein [Rhodococcus koreensis]|uniref:MOSC domain-containing protein n=1 Tax=Rhodococcus koreensis TaxID=99653 RepID=UPI0009353307|nr:MOSC domain-containing protein [Rhodococcus koreensis]